MTAPVLFLVFNRPEKVQRVFEAIAKAKPKQLFVAADGPRADCPDDISKCQAIREIITRVDWDCEVKTLFRESNLGCKTAVASAIDWFFEQVDEGIILEDDCLPSDSFFPFCNELLKRYRDDERVMMISGNNFQDGINRGDASYYFSQIPHSWGWATWRRAWRLFDFQMESLPGWINSGAAEMVWPDQDVRNFWLSKLIPTYEGRLTAWDYRWVFSIVNHRAVSICPAVNLIANIGFDAEATNTRDVNDCCADRARYEIGELVHPEEVTVDLSADEYEYLHVFNTECRSIKNPLMRMRKLLRKRWKAKRAWARFRRQHGLGKVEG